MIQKCLMFYFNPANDSYEFSWTAELLQETFCGVPQQFKAMTGVLVGKVEAENHWQISCTFSVIEENKATK